MESINTQPLRVPVEVDSSEEDSKGIFKRGCTRVIQQGLLEKTRRVRSSVPEPMSANSTDSPERPLRFMSSSFYSIVPSPFPSPPAGAQSSPVSRLSTRQDLSRGYELFPYSDRPQAGTVTRLWCGVRKIGLQRIQPIDSPWHIKIGEA